MREPSSAKAATYAKFFSTSSSFLAASLAAFAAGSTIVRACRGRCRKRKVPPEDSMTAVREPMRAQQTTLAPSCSSRSSRRSPSSSSPSHDERGPLPARQEEGGEMLRVAKHCSRCPGTRQRSHPLFLRTKPLLLLLRIFEADGRPLAVVALVTVRVSVGAGGLARNKSALALHKTGSTGSSVRSKAALSGPAEEREEYLPSRQSPSHRRLRLRPRRHRGGLRRPAASQRKKSR